jgi:nucleotide-binding universal stress UspA family protein
MGARVMVGYDGKPAARAALDVALGLVERLGGELLVTYLFEAPEEEASLCKSLEADGRRITNGALLAAGSRGVRARVSIANRAPTHGLAQIAEERCADLLVVGSRGESPLLGALLGSTPHRLVHLTTLPLLVVPMKRDDYEDH